MFSSILFFSVRDALTVVGRYCASGIVCRMVLKLELSGVGHSHRYEDDSSGVLTTNATHAGGKESEGKESEGAEIGVRP